jgi:quercetin dioxygenase-like cupin family protein
VQQQEKFMFRALLVAAACPTLLAGGAYAAQVNSQHVTFEASEIPWRPAPDSLVPGAKIALLHGRPSQDGVFVIRLLLPKGYSVPPHTHPQPEIITVLSGSLMIGHGINADPGKVQRIGSGGFSALPADMAHYVFVDEETVIQISTTGPWSITYLNPADDPRNKAK